MAENKVRFLRGTATEYAGAVKDKDTFYYTTNDGKLYIGNQEVLGGGSIKIDNALSDTSENPVQNKVINAALKGGNEVTGSSSYTINNSVEYPLLGLNVYGKSVQDGTPTPDAPIDIVSVGGSGSIAIISTDQNGQSMTAEITSALPFCGIPVTSGGNYTDSNGQQWFCDELIYNADGTGKIVKKYNKVKLASANIIKCTQSTAGAAFFTNIIGTPMDNNSYLKPLSNCFLGVTYGSANSSENKKRYRCFLGGTGTLALENPANDDSKFATLEDMKNFVDNNDVYIIYPIAEPQEIELTAAEVAALKALQTFDGVTSISNNSGAEMYVKYCTNKALSEYVLPIMDSNLINSKTYTDTKVESLNSTIGTKANESDLTSHTGNTSNPHNVTKAQVGLGNVPNVTTNDQTPTFTEVSSLTKLTSGEKLSVAFGKISKAITDLIAHIGDSVKHITSTERINWNAAKTHADSAHAPSNAQANIIETVKVNGTALTPSSKAVNVTVPTKVSELTDGSDYVKTTDSRLTDARTPKAHNQASNTINAMTGYSKPSSTSAITTSDSLNTAIGKLEKALDSKQTSGSYAASDHTHDDRYYTETEINTKLNTKLNTSLKGAANGLAELDSSGKVPSAQLPSYVDDVLEYTNKASFPATGESGKIYIAQDTNKTYRWSGSAYVEISQSLALGETSATAYRGDRGKIAYEHSQKAHAPSNAQANQNAFSNIKVGSTTIAADTTTDVLTLVGSNVTLTPDATNDKVTIGITKANVTSALGYTPSTTNVFVKSGSGAKSGLVPAPPTTAGTTKYLREDGTWVVPPDTWRGVIDNLTSTDTTKSLSANQGKVLKGLVDGKAAASHSHNVMTGATADTAGISGFVPAPTAGDQDKFLKADGTWSSPPSVSSSITCIVDGTGATFTYEGNYKLFFYNIKGISSGGNSTVTYESSNGWIILKDTDTAVYRKLGYYSYQSGPTSTSTVNYYLELSHGRIRITRYNNTNSSTIPGVTLEIYAL